MKDKDGFLKAAEKNDIIIAEVGAWSNPLSPNTEERESALKNCINKLAVADEMGARCCVNIAGNRDTGIWDTHSPENFTDEAFDAVVESVRKIIDGAAPKKSYYTLEMMPWMLPYDAESYMKLLKAVDRKQFAVHLDIVNIINSPYSYYIYVGRFVVVCVRYQWGLQKLRYKNNEKC